MLRFQPQHRRNLIVAQAVLPPLPRDPQLVPLRLRAHVHPGLHAPKIRPPLQRLPLVVRRRPHLRPDPELEVAQQRLPHQARLVHLQHVQHPLAVRAGLGVHGVVLHIQPDAPCFRAPGGGLPVRRDLQVPPPVLGLAALEEGAHGHLLDVADVVVGGLELAFVVVPHLNGDLLLHAVDVEPEGVLLRRLPLGVQAVHHGLGLHLLGSDDDFDVRVGDRRGASPDGQVTRQ
mmetsp:Transcript_55304/g.147657  ORF Transcript_55304/g.147657 Transcript_55304/m.147657 type:complete len:231 (+) Transcript_55304:659-1351(+)